MNPQNREHVISCSFWLSMTEGTEKETTKYPLCNSTKPHQQKEPLKLHPISDLPWSTVATDIFEWNSQYYLVAVYSYSGWFEIELLCDLTSNTVITKLKKHFSFHGSPHKDISWFFSMSFSNTCQTCSTCSISKEEYTGEYHRYRQLQIDSTFLSSTSFTKAWNTDGALARSYSITMYS